MRNDECFERVRVNQKANRTLHAWHQQHDCTHELTQKEEKKPDAKRTFFMRYRKPNFFASCPSPEPLKALFLCLLHRYPSATTRFKLLFGSCYTFTIHVI
jgi:hypothetical protein